MREVCKILINVKLLLKTCLDRYFDTQCEPMDATVSPIALTSHSVNTQGDSSNGSSSNPGTPS